MVDQRLQWGIYESTPQPQETTQQNGIRKEEFRGKVRGIEDFFPGANLVLRLALENRTQHKHAHNDEFWRYIYLWVLAPSIEPGAPSSEFNLLAEGATLSHDHMIVWPSRL